MKNYRKILSVLLVLSMLLTGAVAFALELESEGSEEMPGDVIVSPTHEVASFEELQAAVPEISIPALPEGAVEAEYDWFDAEPRFAQIQFAWGEHYYTFRAAACESEEAVADIDGLYLDFDHEETLPGLFEDEFALKLKASEEGSYAVVDWFVPQAKTQYSLFSETAGMPGMEVVELAETLANESLVKVGLDKDGDGDAINDAE